MTARDVRRAVLAGYPEDPLEFWQQHSECLPWAEPRSSVHSWTPPSDDDELSPRATWFDGGRLNASVVCVDQHVEAGRGESIALHFEGERGDRETVSYVELQASAATTSSER